MAKLKRKDTIAPYARAFDERFKVFLVQQQSVYCDLKTMNVEANEQNIKFQTVSQPQAKRPRKA